MNAFVSYFKGAFHEIRNVTWPTEKEAFRLTKIVFWFLVVFTLLFFITDFVLSGFFRTLYQVL